MLCITNFVFGRLDHELVGCGTCNLCCQYLRYERQVFVGLIVPRPLDMSQNLALAVIGDVANVFGGVVYPAKDVLVAISSSIERVSPFTWRMLPFVLRYLQVRRNKESTAYLEKALDDHVEKINDITILCREEGVDEMGTRPLLDLQT